MTRFIVAAQGTYYVIAGLWPIVSLSTFEEVSGPKTDDWLVHTVAVLAIVIGATLLFGVRRRPGAEVLFLSCAGALGFAAIDLTYGLRGTISPVYLADAGVELLFICLVLAGVIRRRA